MAARPQVYAHPDAVQVGRNVPAVLVGLLWLTMNGGAWHRTKPLPQLLNLTSGNIGQALRLCQAAGLAEVEQYAQGKRRWKLTDAGTQLALRCVKRRAGQLPMWAQGLADDGTVTLTTSGWTYRAQLAEPRTGSRRRPALRRRAAARRREAQRRNWGRVLQLAKRIKLEERRAEIREIEQVMQDLAAAGDLAYNPADGTYTVTEQGKAKARPDEQLMKLSSHSRQLLNRLDRACRQDQRGWAVAAQLADDGLRDPRSVGRELSLLADLGWVQTWRPTGGPPTLYRLTDQAVTQLRVAAVA